MSPNVGNFVHDLVEMAKAMEELPKVQDELAKAKRQIDEHTKWDAGRDNLIEQLHDEIHALKSTNHSLEVERDDALLRFLELEEKLGKVAKTFQTALEAMDMADKVVTQATAKPEPDYGPPTEPPPVQEYEVRPGYAPASSAQGNESAPVPTSAGTESGTQTNAQPSAEPAATSPFQTQGERVPDPTASYTAGDGHSSETAPATTAPTTGSASGQEPRLMSASDKPFTGRTWSEVNRNKDALTGWWEGKMLTYTGWLEGGGAAEDWTR